MPQRAKTDDITQLLTPPTAIELAELADVCRALLPSASYMVLRRAMLELVTLRKKQERKNVTPSIQL